MKAQIWRFPSHCDSLGAYSTLDGFQTVANPYYERFIHFDSMKIVEKDYIIAEYNTMKKVLSAIGALTDIEDTVMNELKKTR